MLRFYILVLQQVGLLACLLATTLIHLPAAVDELDDALSVQVGDSKLVFRKHGEWLLGMAEVHVAGYPIRSADTVVKPLVAQEFTAPHGGTRELWPFLRLETVEKGPDGLVTLVCGLYGGSDEALYRAHYVWRGDRKPVLADLPAELQPLQKAANESHQVLVAAVQSDKAVLAARAKVVKQQERDQKKKRTKPSRGTQRAQQAVERAIKQAIQQAVAQDPALVPHQAAIDQWQAALGEAALAYGDLHRDFYAYPLLQQPTEIMSVEQQRDVHDRLAAGTQRRGTLRWNVRPESQVVAGWPWQGWRQNYEVDLDENLRATVVYQLGTWELAGHLDGLTVAAQRNRGLGRIEQAFTGADGMSAAFTTTEIMPGAAGGAPLVSPVVPSSGQGGMDRGNALRHRVGAWICRMARGGGHPFFEFQFRPEAGLIAFPARQGDLRAVTEAMPGDTRLSQTDEERFALANELKTTPFTYLAMVDQEQPFEVNAWRTRWKEWDQHLREVVSADLGLVHPQPLPGVGILKEYGRPGFYRSMAKNMPDWAKRGVQLIASHTPGWWSPQHPDIAGKRGSGGNSNSIYDWKPTHDMHEPWTLFQDACAKFSVRYHSYMTGMVRNDGPFFAEVGPEDANWGRNAPGSDFSHGYPPILNGMNINSKRTSQLLDERIMDVRATYGTQGLWADSFQNMYLSQLSWGDGSGAPQQRTWWEKLGDWSQRGILFMSESYAFPGLSCSIEVPNWEEDLWYFQYVWKWHRGTSQNNIPPERLDAMCFLAMANRGWTAPDGSPDPIPSFDLFATSYNAALPRMQRPYVLPDASAVLWLDDASRTTGVLFSIEAGQLPVGVRAKHLISGEVVDALPKQRVLDVQADNLLEAFAIRQPPHADERPLITVPEPVFPEHAQ
jgi:hypothetical protein